MIRYTVDRIEGNVIVCFDENGKSKELDLSLVENVREGDSVVENNGVYTIDKEYIEIRRKKIIALQNSLWE